MAYPALEARLREELADYGRRAYARGLVAGADGNLSARLADDRFLITPSGCCLGDLRPEDFLVVNGQGDCLGEPIGARSARPSTEHKVHLAVYPVRPDVNAVVHAHPPTAIALSLVDFDFNEPLLPEVIISLGNIGTVPPLLPSTPQIAQATRDVLIQDDVAMLRRHGAVAVGPTVASAYGKLEQLEHTAVILHRALQLRRPEPLTSAQVTDLMALRARMQDAAEARTHG